MNNADSPVTIGVWSPDLADAMARPGRKDVRITSAWPDRGLERLIPFGDLIERLIVEGDLPDPSAISTLRSLRELSLAGDASQVDFSVLSRLETLRLSGKTPLPDSIRKCGSLRVLSVAGAALGGLSALDGLSHLADLEVSGAGIRSLSGLKVVPSLRRLALSDMPLETLEGLDEAKGVTQIILRGLGRVRSVAPLTSLSALRSLEIDGSKKIADIERLGELQALEEFNLVGLPLPDVEFLSRLRNLRVLTLHNVGRIPSLDFLRHQTRLEILGLAENTVVANGDLSNLLKSPSLRIVGFTERPHYSHHLQDIQAILTERGTEGPGSFDNYMARHWSALLSSRRQQLGKMLIAGVLRDTLSYGQQEVPARMGQYAITAVEVVARLLGRFGEQTAGSAVVDQWISENWYEPPVELIRSAIRVLDRLVTLPSGLLELWRQRGNEEQWIDTVNELKKRLTLNMTDREN